MNSLENACAQLEELQANYEALETENIELTQALENYKSEYERVERQKEILEIELHSYRRKEAGYSD